MVPKRQHPQTFLNSLMLTFWAFLMASGPAYATRGGADRNWYKTTEKFEMMHRSGEMKSIIEEGRANVEAFKRLQDAERRQLESTVPTRVPGAPRSPRN